MQCIDITFSKLFLPSLPPFTSLFYIFFFVSYLFFFYFLFLSVFAHFQYCIFFIPNTHHDSRQALSHQILRSLKQYFQDIILSIDFKSTHDKSDGCEYGYANAACNWKFFRMPKIRTNLVRQFNCFAWCTLYNVRAAKYKCLSDSKMREWMVTNKNIKWHSTHERMIFLIQNKSGAWIPTSMHFFKIGDFYWHYNHIERFLRKMYNDRQPGMIYKDLLSHYQQLLCYYIPEDIAPAVVTYLLPSRPVCDWMFWNLLFNKVHPFSLKVIQALLKLGTHDVFLDYQFKTSKKIWMPNGKMNGKWVMAINEDGFVVLCMPSPGTGEGHFLTAQYVAHVWAKQLYYCTANAFRTARFHLCTDKGGGGDIKLVFKAFLALVVMNNSHIFRNAYGEDLNLINMHIGKTLLCHLHLFVIRARHDGLFKPRGRKGEEKHIFSLDFERAHGDVWHLMKQFRFFHVNKVILPSKDKQGHPRILLMPFWKKYEKKIRRLGADLCCYQDLCWKLANATGIEKHICGQAIDHMPNSEKVVAFYKIIFQQLEPVFWAYIFRLWSHSQTQPEYAIIDMVNDDGKKVQIVDIKYGNQVIKVWRIYLNRSYMQIILKHHRISLASLPVIPVWGPNRIARGMDAINNVW